MFTDVNLTGRVYLESISIRDYLILILLPSKFSQV